MKTAFIGLMVFAANLHAITRYVALDGGNVAPYTAITPKNWTSI
jgi:hypothetical protein